MSHHPMTPVTLDQIRAYCQPLKIGVETRHVDRLFFDHCDDCRVYVTQIDSAAEVGFDMAATMVEPDRAAFQGALIWLTDRRNRFENCEAAFRRIRLGFGVDASVEEFPGHLFGPGEFTDAVVMLGFLLTFGWEVIWAPAHGQYLMAVNHDGMLDFAVRGGDRRWDTDRKELFDNLGLKHWPQMTARYCAKS